MNPFLVVLGIVIVLVCNEVRSFSPACAICKTKNIISLRKSRTLSGLKNEKVPKHYHNENRRLEMTLQSMDTLLERLPSEKVIDVIEKVASKSSNSGKVVASDVASLAGVSLKEARQDLTTLASLTSGDIAVTSEGELIYSFPSNIKQVLSQKNLRYKLTSLWNKVKSPLFYLVRVSFGVLLLLSLVVVFSTLAFVSSGGGSDRDDDGRGRRGGYGGGGFSMGFNPFWGPSPFDIFYYRPYYGYYSSPSYYTRGRNNEVEMGFLESTFSYIFGDGNPNANVEQESLKKAANFIRENNGAVTAEQLAPFLIDVPPPSESSSYVDESFVLPIVTQLNGSPEVTEDGDIVYVFPELQVSAQSLSPNEDDMNDKLLRLGIDPSISTNQLKSFMQEMGISTRGALERSDLVQSLTRIIETENPNTSENYNDAIIEEKTYKFSLASPFQQLLAGGLGVVNLLGSISLGNYLAKLAAYGVQLPSYYGVVQTFYPLLLTYAILFNVIPAARYFSIQQKNQKIKDRNKKRRFWNTLVQSTRKSANTALGRKFLAASKLAKRIKLLGNKDVIYDTSSDFEQNQKQMEQQRLTDFDKSLQRGPGEFE